MAQIMKDLITYPSSPRKRSLNLAEVDLGENFLDKISTRKRQTMKKALLISIAILLLLTSSKAQDYSCTEIISIKRNGITAEKIRDMNLDVLMEWNQLVYIVASFDDLRMLRKQNIPFALETLNFYPYRQVNSSLQGGRNGEYHSYSELEYDLFALERNYPHLARVLSIGESLEGRNIYALKVSDNVHTDEDEAEVIFIGCHHAREWISVEVPFLFGQYLLENYNSDSQVRDIVNQCEIWIIPLLNPDGLEYSIHFYRYWRKNMRNNGDGSYGVDLNRNYDYFWGNDNEGSSPNPSSQIYRGSAPFSEPETQAIRDLLRQRNYQALISFHNYSQVIIYPWGYTEDLAPDAVLLDQIAANMSTRIQSVHGNIYAYGQAGISLYLTNGDTTDWSYGTYGAPSFTIELPPVDQLHGGFFNAEEDIQIIFEENLPAMLYLTDWSIQNYDLSRDFSPRRDRYQDIRERMKNRIHRDYDKEKAIPNTRNSTQKTAREKTQPKTSLPNASPPKKRDDQEYERKKSLTKNP